MDQTELDEQAAHDDRMAEARRASELHYAVRRAANILDHKLTKQEAHDQAMRLVAKMHAIWEAAHEVDKSFSRDAPMVLVDTGAVAERKLEAMRDVLDAPLASFKGGA